MRKTILVVALITLATIGYLVWPIYSVGRLVQAVEARDVAAARSLIHASSVRRSLIEQVVETYLKLSGKWPTSPLLHGVVVGAATAVVDPMLAAMFEPDALIELLGTGWPRGFAEPAAAGVTGLNAENLGSAWQIYTSARYGLRRFQIAVPPTAPSEQRFELEFRLIQWRWQLANVRLPLHLRERIAQALLKSQSKR